MRLYFDTNVYNAISKQGKADAVRQWLSDNCHELIGSSTNLIELGSAPEPRLRQSLLATLSSLSPIQEKFPSSFTEAQQVLSEIHRLRPEWLGRPSKRGRRSISDFLRMHRDQWMEAGTAKVSDYAMHRYRQDASTVDKDAQKFTRKRILEIGGFTDDLKLYFGSSEAPTLAPDLSNEELYWRVQACACFDAAINRRLPAVRDFYDWLSPYLRPGVFKGESYLRFWLEDIDGQSVPMTRLRGLLEFNQLRSRITPGNGQDNNHAMHIWGVDVFFTADRAFAKALILSLDTNQASKVRAVDPVENDILDSLNFTP